MEQPYSFFFFKSDEVRTAIVFTNHINIQRITA